MKPTALFLGLALSAIGCFTARADFITTLTATTTPQPGGLTLYQYTLTDLPSSDLNAGGLALAIASGSNPQSITGPAGWDITYLPGNTLVTWESSDISTYYIAPGASETFSFLSPLAPVEQPYLITGTDILGINFDDNSGQIASPGAAVVPEPRSLVLAVMGVLGTIAYGMCRRRRVAGLSP